VSLITTQGDFRQLCRRIRDAGIVAFDTEFVSEFYFRPKLCLLQFGLPDGELRAVDPFIVDNLSEWWDLVTDAETTIVVHGGREELRFCHYATGRRPRNIIDVQVAEGLRSRGYPLSHANLVSRVLGQTLHHGKQTRTDWQRRPLMDQQLDYALEDVKHLLEVWSVQQESLEKQDRLDWAWAEFESLIDAVLDEQDDEVWQRLPGFGKLNRRERAIARELYLWRREAAEIVNKPQRRVLRDDLLIDIAHRQPKSVKQLKMNRDMNRRDYQQHAEAIVEVVHQALQIPAEELPEKPNNPQHAAQDEVLARILGLALANRCQQLGISMPLVGTTADLKDLVRWHVFQEHNGDPPRLLEGWRGEVCGKLLTDVLDGKVTLRVANPRSEYPLEFNNGNE
jgi:ribonuclease D